MFVGHLFPRLKPRSCGHVVITINLVRYNVSAEIGRRWPSIAALRDDYRL
jgi:hypothetical protein